MRFVFPSLLLVVLALTAALAQAQSLSDDLPDGGSASVVTIPDTPVTPVAPPVSAPPQPAAETYTVSDVNADVTADTAAHARDQALMQAERAAFVQLCARLNVPDSAAKLNDDAVAALVQSFEVQSEHLSAVRYIGVFTIRFKPLSTQKKLGKALGAAAVTDAAGNPVSGDVKAIPAGPVTHLAVAVATESLAAFAQMKHRLNAVPQVVRVDTIDLGRGLSHMDLVYAGPLDELQQALSPVGLTLYRNQVGDWQLTDGNVPPQR